MRIAALPANTAETRTASAMAIPTAGPASPASNVAAAPASVASKPALMQMPTLAERLTGSYSLDQS